MVQSQDYTDKPEPRWQALLAKPVQRSRSWLTIAGVILHPLHNIQYSFRRLRAEGVESRSRNGSLLVDERKE